MLVSPPPAFQWLLMAVFEVILMARRVWEKVTRWNLIYLWSWWKSYHVRWMLLLLKEVSLTIQGVRKSFSTHLCFASDLVFFAAGNVNAINSVVTIFDQFYSLYGLIFNPSNCEVFFWCWNCCTNRQCCRI
jgi:hypothetical protein